MKVLTFTICLLLSTLLQAQMQPFTASYCKANKIDSIRLKDGIGKHKDSTNLILKEVYVYDSLGRMTRNTGYIRGGKMIDHIQSYPYVGSQLHSMTTIEKIGKKTYAEELLKQKKKKNLFKYRVKGTYGTVTNYTAKYNDKGQLIETTQQDKKKDSRKFMKEYGFNEKGYVFSIVEWSNMKILRRHFIKYSADGKVISIKRNSGLNSEMNYTFKYISKNLIRVDATLKIGEGKPRKYEYELEVFYKK